ncbi:MAG: acyltransferase family protein [Akkermansia sp.]|nr:acyltransferase family protein [Akkermansia sp.]
MLHSAVAMYTGEDKSCVNKREEFQGLYVLKAICALWVVGIHLPLVGKADLMPLFVSAVPCFYIISGFFLYKGGDSIKERACAWKWCKKIFTVACLINVFYFAVAILRGEWPDICEKFCISFVTGDTVNGALWYLTAMWEALCVFIFCRRFFSDKVIYVFSFFILFNLLLGKYYFIFDAGEYDLPQCIRLNWLTVALPCMSVGYLLRKHELYFKNVKVELWVVIFMLLSYIEYFVLKSFCIETPSYYLFTLPMAVCLVLVCKNLANEKLSLLANIGKNHSSNIYYFHMFLGAFIGFLSFHLEINVKLVTALIVYVGCIFFSMGVNYLCQSVRNLWRNIYKGE